jgi:septum formation topological specificity factor MinE
MLTEKGITRGTIPIEMMSELLDERLKSLVLAKERTVDANHVLVALTARLVSIVRRNAKSEE